MSDEQQPVRCKQGETCPRCGGIHFGSTYCPYTVQPQIVHAPATPPKASIDSLIPTRWKFEIIADGNVALFNGDSASAAGLGLNADEAIDSALACAASQSLADRSELSELRETLEKLAQRVIDRSCLCSMTGREDWHSPSCPVPDAKRALLSR